MLLLYYYIVVCIGLSHIGGGGVKRDSGMNSSVVF